MPIDYDHEATETLTEELQAAVLEILERHQGAGKAITVSEIVERLGMKGHDGDHLVRAAIRELRYRGHLILSSVEQPDSYFVAATKQEWLAFRDSVLKPRALDILETASAMGRAAARRWGEKGPQPAVSGDDFDLVA